MKITKERYEQLFKMMSYLDDRNPKLYQLDYEQSFEGMVDQWIFKTNDYICTLTKTPNYCHYEEKNLTK